MIQHQYFFSENTLTNLTRCDSRFTPGNLRPPTLKNISKTNFLFFVNVLFFENTDAIIITSEALLKKSNKKVIVYV